MGQLELNQVVAETKSSRGTSYVHIFGAAIGAWMTFLAFRKFRPERQQERQPEAPDYIDIRPKPDTSETPSK